SSGNLTVKPEDNTLTITANQGRTIAVTKLVGARDLTKSQSDACRDAALVQWWLSQIPDTDPKHPNESVYKNVDKQKHLLVDGKWGRMCLDALERFKKQYSPSGTDWKS